MKRAVWIPLCMHFLLIYMGVKGDFLIIALAVDGVDSVFFSFVLAERKRRKKRNEMEEGKKERRKKKPGSLYA